MRKSLIHRPEEVQYHPKVARQSRLIPDVSDKAHSTCLATWIPPFEIDNLKLFVLVTVYYLGIHSVLSTRIK